MRIYAIDDEIGSLGLLEDAIKEVLPGEEVLSFTQTSKMLQKAKELPPDVAFMDIEMPGMTGLELSEALRELNPNVNLVFVTGYSEYALEAIKHYASDYIMKPVDANGIRKAMQNLRNPIDEKKHILIRTFGNFGIFVDGKPVKFRSAKSQELLAYLVDRCGSPINRKEAAAVLFEDGCFDRNEQKSLSRVATRLQEDLESAGAHGFLLNDDGRYSVDVSLCDCDLFEFLDGNRELFLGEYMEQYSWGEDRKGLLM